MKIIQYCNRFDALSKNRKTLVYSFGSEAGFFSEVNNMVLAVLYCLKHDINFVLYDDSSLCGRWICYFMPFCAETHARGHAKYNYRQPYFVPRGRLYRIKSSLFKFFSGFDYYTYELWPEFHNRLFESEEFDNGDIHGSTQNACRCLLRRGIFRYNQQTTREISSIIHSLKLPKEYLSIHIRRGDKGIESELYDVDDYMKCIEYESCKYLFVGTDDYNVVSYIQNVYPQYTVYSLTEKGKNGYSQSSFNELCDEDKRKEIITLLATIEVFCKSKRMVGSFSSNIGMFCGMMMSESSFADVHSKNWVIW